VSESVGNIPLKDVTGSYITIVIDKDAHEGLRQFTDLEQNLQHEQLLVGGTVGTGEDGQEDLGEEDANLVLFPRRRQIDMCISGAKQQAVSNSSVPSAATHLQMVLEVENERVEDVERELEDLLHGRDAIREKRHAEVLLDGLVDESVVRSEHGAGVLDDEVQELEREDAVAHIGRVGVGGAAKRKRFST